MNRIAFAALASLALTAVAGCSASASDDHAADTAALSSSATTTTAIAIDFTKDVANLVCNTASPASSSDWSVQFDYQGVHFDEGQKVAFSACQSALGTLAASGVEPAELVLKKDGAVETRTITLTVDRRTFTAKLAGADGVTTTVSNISFDFEAVAVNPICRVEMGWWIVFGFEGREFQGYGADDVTDCRANLAAIRGEGARPATLTEERHSDFVKRTIIVDDRWTFTSYEKLRS